MEFERPEFKKVYENPNEEFSEDFLEQWIAVSEDYQDEHGLTAIGMHVGCVSKRDKNWCYERRGCDGTGHAYITKIYHGAVAMLGCTNADCPGVQL